MFINAKSTDKVLRNNILELASKAKKAKNEDPNVINATIGMLFDEKGKLYQFESVKKVEDVLSTEDKYSYSNTRGSEDYQKAIKEWTFGPYYGEVMSHNFLNVLPTPGGTGALSLIFANYVDKGETVLMPNYMWENYLTFGREEGFNIDCYSLFKGNSFDFESIKLKVDYLKQKQQRIVILLNDPCENPTGFCMKDEDYDALIQMANNSLTTQFIFIMDMAYFDFYNVDGKVIRKRFAKLANLGENSMVFFCFSGSKSFGLYGLRVGALLQMTKSESEAAMFLDAGVYTSRGRWSSTSTMGEKMITELILNPDHNDAFHQEVASVSKMLEERSKAFLEGAKEEHLEILPYQKGFFLCVPTKDATRLVEALHKDKVYVIPLKNAIRIAICAINKKEASILPKIIKGRMMLEDL